MEPDQPGTKHNSEYAVPLRFTQIGLRPTSFISRTLYKILNQALKKRITAIAGGTMIQGQ